MEPIRIFISYAHANAIWLRKTVMDRAGTLEPNPKDLLSYWRNGLQFEGEVEFWYDRDEDEGLRGGDVWEKRIFDEIDRAHVGVLLITQEFVQSGFIRRKELPRMVARAERGEMELVPVLVEPARWEDLDLARFQFTPGRPPTPLLKSQSEHDYYFKSAMLEVMQSLKARVCLARQRRDGATATAKQAQLAPSVVGPRAGTTTGSREAAPARVAQAAPGAQQGRTQAQRTASSCSQPPPGLARQGRAGDSNAIISATPPPANGLGVYVTQKIASGPGQIAFRLRVDNKRPKPVDMSTVTLRYWYQDEGLGTSLVMVANYVSIGYSNLGKVTEGKAVAVSPSKAGADHYIELSFSGTLAAKGDSKTNDQFTANVTMHTASYQGAVDLTNDYSYNDGATGYNEKITLHDKSGKVVWGMAPGLPSGSNTT
jgi:hypothetical protein